MAVSAAFRRCPETVDALYLSLMCFGPKNLIIFFGVAFCAQKKSKTTPQKRRGEKSPALCHSPDLGHNPETPHKAAASFVELTAQAMPMADTMQAAARVNCRFLRPFFNSAM